MKKVLLTVTALGLGLALTASVAAAEMSFSASGKYNLTGMWISDGGTVNKDSNGNTTGWSGENSNGMVAGVITPVDPGNESNDMWHHSAYLYPKLMVNDNVRMVGELRFIDREVYGSTDSWHATTGGDSDAMKVYKLWMEYDSPIGTVYTGRMGGGTFGDKFMDSTYAGDRVKLVTPINDDVTLAFVYQKYREEDGNDSSTQEADAAQYYAGVSFKHGAGKTTVATWHSRFDEDSVSTPNGEYSNTELWYHGVYGLGPVNLAAEIKYAMGEDSADNDISSLAAMANASMKFNSVTAGILTFYGQGQWEDNGGDNEGYITRSGFGNDFNPFLIATNDYTGLLNGDKNDYIGESALGMVGNPGALALALYGIIPINDALTINAAIGSIWADDVGSTSYDDQVGMELDIGMKYKLLDNLTYSAQFGYMKTGDFFEDMSADLYSGAETNDIMMLVHELTMTF